MALASSRVIFAPRALMRANVVVLSVALLKLLLHIATNWRYGFHRDEFYYIVGGFHLDWGYVDHPPLTPLLARVATTLFGVSLPGLRLFPALAGVGIVLMTGLSVRRLGGGLWAQTLATLAVLFAPMYLAGNTLFQTVSFDQFWWVLCCYLVILLVATGNPRLWLGIGLVIGLGLQTKYTMALFALGLMVGVLLTPARSQLRTPWPWLGIVLAISITLPNLLWQFAHQFPTVEFTRNNSAKVQLEQTRLDFVLKQLLLAGPISLPLVITGGWFFWPVREHPYRVLGWAMFAVCSMLLLVNSKPYYLAPLYPLLYAGGAVVIERWVTAWAPRLRAMMLGVFVLLSLPPLPAALPLLPVQTMVQWKIYELNEDFAEMVGWPDALRAVAAVYDGLPPLQQQRSTILTTSYGEAAAIDLLGPAYKLPPAISAHNSYYFWSAGQLNADTYIVLGYSAERLASMFDEVQRASVISNGLGVPNELYQRPIHICRRPKIPLPQQWLALKHFN